MKDEFAFIRSIAPGKHFHPEIVKGIGDDAACYKVHRDEHQVVCTDTMVEGVHFLKETMPPFAIGWKLLASNLSDIAAMGGIPDYYLVSVAFPEEWLDDGTTIYEGISALADRFQVDLIGGDTVSAPDALVLTATVIGHTDDRRLFLRSNARPGDQVFVTGTLGDSAAGLGVLSGSLDVADRYRSDLIRKHQLPFPRLDASSLLKKAGCRSALDDISDGLASESYEIAEASSVSLVIDASQLPVSEALASLERKEQLACMLYGGEDYELLMTVPPEAADRLQRIFSENNTRLTLIGNVIESEEMPSVFLMEDGRRKRLVKAGYNHFNK